VLVALTLLGLTNRAAAQGLVPERMSFQGFMEDAGGVPLGQSAPVNLPVVFRVFPVATGGTASWAESQNVTFDKGRYSVLLGSGAQEGSEPHGNLSALVRTNAGNLLYVETTVTINGTPAKISPRLRLVASPYALLATRALSSDSADTLSNPLDLSDVSNFSGSLPGSKLANDSVTAQQIASSAVTEVELAAQSVTTTKLTNGAVTTPKIADNAVTPAKIAPGAVNSSKIGGVLLDTQIPDLDASKITTGTLLAARMSSVVARRDLPNTFTGTQTINGNLIVTNNLSLGTLGQLKVTAGEESLRIVRGRVRLVQGGAGNAPAYDYEGVNAVGFTVQQKSPYAPVYQRNGASDTTRGVAEITFNPPFTDTPVVTVTPWMEASSLNGLPNFSNLAVSATVHEISTSKVVVSFINHQNSGYQFDSPFTFIAIGTR
jgi:hypothetical protein